jgi:hypothetical protein
MARSRTARMFAGIDTIITLYAGCSFNALAYKDKYLTILALQIKQNA